MSGERRPGRAERAVDRAIPASSSRRVALDALVDIEASGAYANLRLGPILAASGLDDRDRRLVTELVYGTIRRQRSLDYLADRFLASDPPAVARAALRLGAYQLRFTDIPDHAAVSSTVDATPKRFRGMVNAVLRKVATSPVDWPDDATRLSYPDWVVDLMEAEHGDEGHEALEMMNHAPEVSARADGYRQDRSSQRVAEAVGATAGELVIDVCAAPGGKATAMALDGARVVAADIRPHRVKLIADNVAGLGASRVWPVVADAAAPPFREAIADHVLVDAPCSGLGVLRRRADARWRIERTDVRRLAGLQLALLRASAGLVKPGGVLTYSVCTVTRAETIEVAEAFARADQRFTAMPPPEEPWRPWGDGALLLPQDDDSDGMALFSWRRSLGGESAP